MEMNCCGIVFKHQKWGIGVCVNEAKSTLSIQFRDLQEVKIFSKGPDTFRSHLFAVEPNIQNQLLVDSLVGYETVDFEGDIYCRKPNCPWKDLRLITVSDSLQVRLSARVKELQEEKKRREAEEREKKRIAELRSLSVEELLQRASDISSRINDSFRFSYSNGNARPANLANDEEKALAREAIPLYEIAFDKILASPELTDADVETLRCYIPSLSARYRNAEHPEYCKTRLYDVYSLRCPKALGHEFFTSLSAAYADLTDIEGALECLDIAYRFNGNSTTAQMLNVIPRIRYLMAERETNIPGYNADIPINISGFFKDEEA